MNFSRSLVWIIDENTIYFFIVPVPGRYESWPFFTCKDVNFVFKSVLRDNLHRLLNVKAKDCMQHDICFDATCYLFWLLRNASHLTYLHLNIPFIFHPGSAPGFSWCTRLRHCSVSAFHLPLEHNPEGCNMLF